MPTQSETESLNPKTNNGGGLKAYNSYHNDPPVVQQLDDVLPVRHAYYGDATLEPNTGLTNSYDYALFGLALHELLDRLRLSIIIASCLMFIITFFTWWTRLFRPFDMILSIVLGILVLTLLVVEGSSIWKPVAADTVSASSLNIATLKQEQEDPNSRNRAKLETFLKFTEHIGLMVLFHPIGRTAYLVVCGILCWILGGAWELLLGLLFFANAAVLLYCWVTYPEFRRTFQSPHAEEGEKLLPKTDRSESWTQL